MNLKFPKDFKWGSGVSGNQVEGEVVGKRVDDWAEYIKNHPDKKIIQDGEIGPNWWEYPNAEKDLEIVAKLGLNAQRLGIEWARIEPEEGKISQDALKRYREIVDYCKKIGLSPMITLYHFTLPEWIAKKGGWENPETVTSFKKYVEVVLNNFGDVLDWITINEPTGIIQLGYLAKYWPPAKFDPIGSYKVFQNLVKAHNQCYKLIKDKIPKSLVGVTNSVFWYKPHDPNWFFDRWAAKLANHFHYNSFIKATIDHSDFIGVNFYSGFYTKSNPSYFAPTYQKNRELDMWIVGAFWVEFVRPLVAFRSDQGHSIIPDFLIEAVEYLYNNFKKPIIITESGLADKYDEDRAFMILTHAMALYKLMQKGVDIKGYYHWSTVDNLELMEGYKYKFGLISCDAKTGERKTRDSAKLYGEIASSGSIDVKKLANKYFTDHQKEELNKFLTKSSNIV